MLELIGFPIPATRFLGPAASAIETLVGFHFELRTTTR